MTAAFPAFLLCSASPRRAAILASAGIPFDRGKPPDVDETPPAGVRPDAVAEALAGRKARAAAARAPGRLVVCADTVVLLDGEVLGKPDGAADAVRMLRALSGRRHEVVTGVAVARDRACVSGAARTAVTFRALTPAEIEAYVATGEPLDKAGAYAVQGGASAFVERLEGDLDTVIGLPLATLRDLLARAPA